jgi:hypothetical protein
MKTNERCVFRPDRLFASAQAGLSGSNDGFVADQGPMAPVGIAMTFLILNVIVVPREGAARGPPCLIGSSGCWN